MASEVSTQILECQLANNQAARAAASVAGGDGKFDGLSSKHGCFCQAIHCRGQQNGGNCPECMMRAQQGEIRTVVGPGQCPYNCRKMIDPSSTPRTKKRACIVRVALAERNQSFVSIIEDTLPACSQEALDVCMLQASLQE